MPLQFFSIGNSRTSISGTYLITQITYPALFSWSSSLNEMFVVHECSFPVALESQDIATFYVDHINPIFLLKNNYFRIFFIKPIFRRAIVGNLKQLNPHK